MNFQIIQIITKHSKKNVDKGKHTRDKKRILNNKYEFDKMLYAVFCFVWKSILVVEYRTIKQYFAMNIYNKIYVYLYIYTY